MAFYCCPKCKKVWQYPLKECPDCFLKLERINKGKTRVIGLSKVNIPSLFHQKVPYFVLVLEDEKGNRWVQKSQKEYKIGDPFMIESFPEKNGVTIWRIKYDFLEAIEKVVEVLGGLDLKSDSKVLVLPTLEKASHAYFRDNSSPEFLDGALKFLLKKGIKPENIKVVSQSFDEVPIEAKAQKSGLLAVCQKNKVRAVDLAQENFVKKENLEISQIAFRSDLILNLPILKMGKAQASENIFFFLKKETFSRQRYLTSEKEVFENLKKFLPLYLTIAEANQIQDLKKFTVYLGLVLASFNPQNLDRLFFEITKSAKLPEILKDVKIEDIPVLGRRIEEVEYYEN